MPMTADEWAAYQAYLKAQTPAPAAPAAPAPAAPIAPVAPAAPSAIAHEQAPDAKAPARGPAYKMIADLNAQHSKTHNMFKCPSCRKDLKDGFREMGIEVADKDDELVLYGENLEPLEEK